SVSLFNRGVKHALRRFPDVASGAIALDKGDDGIVRNFQPPMFGRDALAVRGRRNSIECRHKSNSPSVSHELVSARKFAGANSAKLTDDIANLAGNDLRALFGRARSLTTTL